MILNLLGGTRGPQKKKDDNQQSNAANPQANQQGSDAANVVQTSTNNQAQQQTATPADNQQASAQATNPNDAVPARPPFAVQNEAASQTHQPVAQEPIKRPEEHEFKPANPFGEASHANTHASSQSTEVLETLVPAQEDKHAVNQLAEQPADTKVDLPQQADSGAAVAPAVETSNTSGENVISQVSANVESNNETQSNWAEVEQVEREAEGVVNAVKNNDPEISKATQTSALVAFLRDEMGMTGKQIFAVLYGLQPLLQQVISLEMASVFTQDEIDHMNSVATNRQEDAAGIAAIYDTFYEDKTGKPIQTVTQEFYQNIVEAFKITQQTAREMMLDESGKPRPNLMQHLRKQYYKLIADNE